MKRFHTYGLSLVISAALVGAPQCVFAQSDEMPATMAPTQSVQHMVRRSAGFATEAAASEHCPSDTIVWMNTRSHAIHLKNDPLYGKTKHGTFMCKSEVGMRTRRPSTQAMHVKHQSSSPTGMPEDATPAP